MNKKIAVITATVTGGILTLSACSKSDYSYEVSGIVQEQYVDYEDCPLDNLAMEHVGFSEASNGGTGSSKKSDNGSSGKKADGPVKKQDSPTKKASTAPSTSGGAGLGTTAKPSAKPSAKAPSNKGVKLKSKPEKPERVKNIGKPAKKQKGCKEEYEIFVLANDGYTYEQDVRKVDYDKCLEAKVEPKLFPLCTNV